MHISLPLGSLARLETLHLQFNLLPSLPGSVADLKALKTLDLSHNQLTSLPPALYSLPHLDYLNLNHNRLQALPEQGLSHLTALELNLSTNSLSCLPAELGMCKRLKVLRVEENCLELAGLPQQLLEESKVSLLCLDGNLFQQKELQELPGYQQVTFGCAVLLSPNCSFVSSTWRDSLPLEEKWTNFACVWSYDYTRCQCTCPQ